jgi:hypothetical protein
LERGIGKRCINFLVERCTMISGAVCAGVLALRIENKKIPVKFPVAGKMAAYLRIERDDLSTEQRHRILLALESIKK